MRIIIQKRTSKGLNKIYFLSAIILISCSLYSQGDSTESNLKFTGFLDVYYLYDFAEPSDHNRPPFVFSFNRHNEFNLNLGFIKAAFNNGKVKGNLGLMTGTYSNANLANEPGVLKNIYEANVGIKLSKKKNTWLETGIFSSHIGFESAQSTNCWNLTRSLLADNSPYYECGLKISNTSKNEKWFLSGLILNGWQRIKRQDGNSALALGHQLTYKLNSKTTLNSSSFIGADTPDSIRQMRYFHNFYMILQATDKFGLTVGFDNGIQQKHKGSKGYHSWYSPVLILQYILSEKSTIAVRTEYFSDENGVIISSGTPNGFQTFGYSLNFDYKITDNACWRIEGRGFNSKDKVFLLNEKPTYTNYTLVTSIAVSF